MKSSVFLDTSYVVALLSPSDRHHATAGRLARQLQQEQTALLTSRAVFLEIGAIFSKPAVRATAIRFLSAFEEEGTFEVVPLHEPLYYKAFSLFSQRLDKSWSLTDCISFIIMQERGIQQALTADVHFQQADFTTLLLEEN